MGVREEQRTDSPLYRDASPRG